MHWGFQNITSNEESLKESILRKQRNTVKILNYIIVKSNIWPKAESRNVRSLFSYQKQARLQAPLDLSVFLMEEMGFELCQIIPLVSQAS